MTRDRRRATTRPKCLTCGGKGTVIQRWKDSRGRWQSREVTCTACGGTGEQ